jgi:hypothetical protein
MGRKLLLFKLVALLSCNWRRDCNTVTETSLDHFWLEVRTDLATSQRDLSFRDWLSNIWFVRCSQSSEDQIVAISRTAERINITVWFVQEVPVRISNKHTRLLGLDVFAINK